MTYDTTTETGRQKRVAELVEGYKKTGNHRAIVRLIGGSLYDHEDYSPGLDDGEEPITLGVEPYISPDAAIERMTEGELYEANEAAGIGH
jgi:hypothetical protein